ncbi:hypothetical protein CAMGR0001_0429 [Campylobacter gracilis RM3268]|uniref:Uncharacterized protein n=1 Tax=Campylobacter gracilis RM3268 TaxID=553220 RepID=C8PHI4_9BACT|nr:hypothetical protein CAMGR0001_0429 [Campylobacter gracilis RM3268]
MQGGNLISCRRQSACRYLGEILVHAAFGALVRASLRSTLAIANFMINHTPPLKIHLKFAKIATKFKI